MRGRSNTRWCPTPQQVMVLEQLYGRGLKTPTASQIQKITAHLSLYGNIQGKNVFYWFQNHKARDRQKLRKTQLHLHYQRLLHHHHFPSPSPSPSPSLSPSLHNIIHFQVNGVGEEEEVPGEAMRRYGRHDPTMIMEVGPTIACCRRSPQPLQTLQLFPLTASTDDHLHKSPAASFTQS